MSAQTQDNRCNVCYDRVVHVPTLHRASTASASSQFTLPATLDSRHFQYKSTPTPESLNTLSLTPNNLFTEPRFRLMLWRVLELWLQLRPRSSHNFWWLDLSFYALTRVRSSIPRNYNLDHYLGSMVHWLTMGLWPSSWIASCHQIYMRFAQCPSKWVSAWPRFRYVHIIVGVGENLKFTRTPTPQPCLHLRRYTHFYKLIF